MNPETRTPFDYTPTCVKALVRVICIFSLAVICFNHLFPAIQLFTLNSLCIHSFYLWQPISSLFLIPSSDLTFSFFLDFFFAMLILYSAGKTLVFAYGRNHFFTLFALGGLTAGITALLGIYIFDAPYYIFSSTFPAILAIVIAWIMLIPYQKIFLYFVVPIKANWIFALAVIGTVCLNAARGDYIQALAYLTALLTGYLYSLLVLGLSGPFSMLLPFEHFLKHAAKKIHLFLEWKILKKLRISRSKMKMK